MFCWLTTEDGYVNEVVMTRKHLKLGYLLCVLHLLGSGKDAFHKEIRLTFRDLSFGGDDPLSKM